MTCPDCGLSAPPATPSTWLATHLRTAHHLPRHLECPPCEAGTDAASLQDVRDWAWRHATCGLPGVPSDLYTALTRKAANHRAPGRARRRRRREPVG